MDWEPNPHLNGLPKPRYCMERDCGGRLDKGYCYYCRKCPEASHDARDQDPPIELMVGTEPCVRPALDVPMRLSAPCTPRMGNSTSSQNYYARASVSM